MIPDTQPGTLSLTLKIGAQEKYIKYRTNIVEGILKETEFKNLKLAALNTLGAFKFHQGEFLEASGYFQRVLDEDPGNINARANLHHVHLSLKSPSGRQFDDHLRKANDVGGTEEDMARRLARCLAEQAFAVRGTCAATFADTDGFFRSNELYSRALSLVEDMPFEREFGGWKILMITNLRNICRNWDRLEQTSQTIKEYYREAVDLTCSLYETVRGKKEYALLEGHALVHLGYILSKTFRNIDNSQWNLKSTLQAKYTNLSWELEDHLECFKRAMTLAPSSTKVINMYARSMSLYLNGDMHTSLELLEQSISIDPSPVNWFARFERADIRRRQYLADKRAWEDGGSVPDRGLLLKAVKDYLFIIKCTPCPYYTCELAMVYCEIAMSYKQTEETQANEYTMKSLECFQQALFTLDGRQLPHIHYFHGLCLKNFGELRYAIEAFKRSVESHSKGSKKTGCLEHLLDSLCKEYIHNGDRDQSHSILSEMTFWVISAFDKYDAERLKLALEACAIKEPLAFTDMTINIAIAEKAFSVGEICSDICLRLGKATSVSYYAQRMRETCSVMKDSQQFVLSTRAPTARNKGGFKYDFVIIYSDGDRPWVLYSLLLKLEQEFSFKGFVDDRDAIPGKSHLHNFEYALENSYKALLILSPDFLDNAWCNHEMQTAITRMLNQKQSNKVLPIKIKECETPDTLNCIKPFQAFDSVQWEILLEAIQ